MAKDRKYETRAEQDARTDRAIANAPEFDEQAGRTEASTLRAMAGQSHVPAEAYQPSDVITHQANAIMAQRANKARADVYDEKAGRKQI